MKITGDPDHGRIKFDDLYDGQFTLQVSDDGRESSVLMNEADTVRLIRKLKTRVRRMRAGE